jgi:hypothetical protein
LFNHILAAVSIRIDAILFVEPSPSFKRKNFFFFFFILFKTNFFFFFHIKGVWNSLTSILSRQLLNNTRNVTLDELKMHISSEKLLSTFGGKLKFSNKSWMSDRLVKEPQIGKEQLKLIDKKEEGEDLSGHGSVIVDSFKTQRILASYFDRLNNDGIYRASEGVEKVEEK